MFLKRVNILPEIISNWELNGIISSCDKQYLQIMSYSDLGFNDGYLLIEKTDDQFILWEYYKPVLTHDARMLKHILQKSDNVRSILQEIKSIIR